MKRNNKTTQKVNVNFTNYHRNEKIKYCNSHHTLYRYSLIKLRKTPTFYLTEIICCFFWYLFNIFYMYMSITHSLVTI